MMEQINALPNKPKKSLIEKIAFSIIILFSLVGLFLSSIIIHEYSHYFDYRGKVTNDELCGLQLPKITENSIDFTNTLGFYKFSYNENTSKEIQEISKTTETKAYFINFIIFLAFDICLAIVIIQRVRMRKQLTGGAK